MFALARDNDVIDQDARHADSIGWSRFVQQPLDLRDDFTAAVMHGLSDCQNFAQHGLFVHHEIAERIGGRRTNETDVNGKRLVEQPRLAEQFDSLDQVLRRDIIHPTTSLGRVDECAESHVSEATRPSRCDVAEQVADHALRKTVGFDFVVDRQPTEHREHPPMPADHSPQKALVAKVIQAARLRVPLTGGIDERQAARMPLAQEAAFDRHRQAFGMSRPDEAAADDGHPILNQRDRFVGRTEQRCQTSTTHPISPSFRSWTFAIFGLRGFITAFLSQPPRPFLKVRVLPQQLGNNSTARMDCGD